MAQLNFTPIRLHTEKHQQSQKITTNHQTAGAWTSTCNMTAENELKAWHTSISLPSDCHTKLVTKCNTNMTKTNSTMQQQTATRPRHKLPKIKTSEENDKNKDNNNDNGKHNAGSTQKQHHDLRQATTTGCSKH
jgi:hypothetical protein